MMPLIAFPASLRTLFAVPFFAVFLAFPASAETNPSPVPPPPPVQAETDPSAVPPKPVPEVPNPENTEADPSLAPEAPKRQVLVNIDKSTQEMTVFVDGVAQHTWPVSTGVRGYSTPSGTYTATSMNEIWYSKQWDDAPMPHSVFFTKRGHAIHATTEVKKLGKPASHGCVRLAPENAKTFFQLVKATGLENVQVVLEGETPGGESNAPQVASPGYGNQVPRGYNPWFEQPGAYYPPPRRGGLFGWGKKNKKWRQQQERAQGYYGPRFYYQPRGIGPRGY